MAEKQLPDVGCSKIEQSIGLVWMFLGLPHAIEMNYNIRGQY